MTNSGIYSITNLINGKKYIGQTYDFNKRKIRHFSELRSHNHHNIHLQRAFDKYGDENFVFIPLLYCNKEDLTYYEEFFIKYFNTLYNGYNMKLAQDPPNNKGKNNGMYGKKPYNTRLDIDNQLTKIAKDYKKGKQIKTIAEEYGVHRKTIRLKLQTVFSKEEMEGINKKQLSKYAKTINKGNHLSKETRNKISETKKGTIVSEEICIKLSEIRNTSGYYKVFKQNDERYAQGFRWRYEYREDGKKKYLSSVDINKLEEKVKSKGLKWMKIVN